MFCVAGNVTNESIACKNEERTINLQNAETAEPRGLFTSLTLKIDSADGKIFAMAKNEFTLFPATVVVRVELYSSLEYKESYADMTFESRVTTPDLNIGKSITTEANIEGVARYWRARMIYKIDGKKEETKETLTIHYDANGNMLD